MSGVVSDIRRARGARMARRHGTGETPHSARKHLIIKEITRWRSGASPRKRRTRLVDVQRRAMRDAAPPRHFARLKLFSPLQT